MKGASKVISTLALLCLLPLLASAETKVVKPRPGEVVVVARFGVTPGLDRDFFSHYATFETPYVKMSLGKGYKKGDIPPDTIQLVTTDRDKKGFQLGTVWTNETSTPLGKLGDISMAKLTIPKSREIELSYVRVYIVDSAFLYFDLPLNRKITVPEGVNYVYLGSFNYELANEYFDIKSISKDDEFDGAQAALAATYGPEARLVRVNLKEIETK